ncbi:MAG: long-chain fatty acid--CoA ligase [Nitrospirae bacterium]|nr:long-chain fatty acid--CoA ligase [Nitrospirota bacterium]MBI5695869.1 long-chain fatty acid--CoA ligase [Nitrospirota bacterium]
MDLGGMLARTATAYPRRVALDLDGRKYTYSEIDHLASAFALGLRSIGVRPGGRVAILLGNSLEFVVAYFGAVRAGAAAVPLNTFLTAPELAYILKDSGADVLVSSPDFGTRLGALRKDGAIKLLVVTGGPGGKAAPEDAIPFDSLLGQPAGPATVPGIIGDRGKTGSPDGGVDTAEDSPAAILYTSGTTGHPKGAILTHRNLISNATACAEAFRITKRDRFLLFLPMFHAFSLTVCLLLPFSVGARVFVLPSVKPFSKVIKAVVLGRITFFVAIPGVYNILSMKKFPRLLMRLLPLRLCVSGAAPLPGETLERFTKNFPFPLLEGYGLTETSPVVSVNPRDGVCKPGSVGLPVPGVLVRIVDEAGLVLPAGHVGEITVRGPNVMRGYLGNDAATAETIRDGWLFTGDMGYRDEEGYIFIADRKKDLIIVHGMNVYPREVEEVIYQHPAVKDAAVIGVCEPGHGEAPKAFVTLRDGASATDRDIRNFVKARLAPYKVPRQVEVVESLPTSPTGKILKKELRRLVAAAADAGHCEAGE